MTTFTASDMTAFPSDRVTTDNGDGFFGTKFPRDALIYSTGVSPVLPARSCVLRRRRQAGRLSRRRGAQLWADRAGPAGDVQQGRRPRCTACSGSQPARRHAPHPAALLDIMPPPWN